MFSCSLDPAYLGHRLLLSDPSEAEDEVVTMLVAEVLSILEHGGVAKQAGIDSIRAWINEMTIRKSLRPRQLFEHPQDSEDTLLGLLENGFDNTPDVKLGKRKLEKVTHAFTLEDSLCR